MVTGLRDLRYAAEFVESVPHDRVVQFHLSRHSNLGTYCIDTHSGQVVAPVWGLYQLAHEFTGSSSTRLEWDARTPPFSEVHAAVLKAGRPMGRQLAGVPDPVEDVICRSRDLTSIGQLGVYGNAYYARLLECLREFFQRIEL